MRIWTTKRVASASDVPLVAPRDAIAAGVRALGSVGHVVVGTTRRRRQFATVRSPFVAAAVAEAVSAANGPGGEIRAYLRATREPDGSWRFDPDGRAWPPDADTTSCALATLARAEDVDGEPIVTRILEEQPGPDGLIRPWLAWYPEAAQRWNTTDAIVTANFVLAATRVGTEVGDVVRAVDQHVGEHGLNGVASVYYDSLPIRAYYLARAVAPQLPDGAAADEIRRFVAAGDVSDGNAAEVAATLAAGVLVGADPAQLALLRTRLLALRTSDGGWPASRWFTDLSRVAWHSAAFTIAIAVEALVLAEEAIADA